MLVRFLRTDAARLSAAHHALASVFVTVYGYHVCSIINALDVLVWAVTLVPVIFAQWVASCWLVSRSRREQIGSDPFRLFSIEFVAFAVGGIVIGVINTHVHGVPAINGVKVALSFLALGIFAALDQAIFSTRERLQRGGLPQEVETVDLTLTAKIFWFLGIMIALVLAIAGSLMLRLLEEPGPDTGRALAIELSVLFVSFVVYMAYLTARSRAVLALALEDQLAALDAATSGQNGRRARIALRDEIGMVSTRINRTLDALQAAEQQRAVASAALLRGLIGLAGSRSNETGQHLARTQRYIGLIAAKLAQQPRYAAILTPDVIARFVAAAPLHDIGKVAIPDAVLLKPDQLAEDELTVMKTHVEHGVRVMDEIIAAAGESPFLLTAREIVGGHHEKFDGSGYPRGLSGEDIPLAARLMAIADVYDALRTKRVYKPAFDREAAARIIIADAGKHFDPDVVAAFVSVEPILGQLSEAMADDKILSPTSAGVDPVAADLVTA